MDNSIKLKELYVENGALRNGDEGLQFPFLFQKGFFWVRRGGWDNSTPFQRRFFERIRKGEFFLGWGLTQRFVSWVAWEGEVWLFLKVGLKNKSRNYSFGSVGWGVWRRQMGIYFLSFFLL